jgi:hypothetical protein
MEFYKIEKPTTRQIFDAIIAQEYTPIESIMPKARQIKVLLLDYWNAKQILVTFDGVTNTGGIPIFMSEGTCLHEIASEINKDWYDMSEEEQDNEIELLGCYLRSYDDIFTTKQN